MVAMSDTRWLTETEQRAWSGFLETYELLDRHVDQQLRQAGGLTKVQYEVLHHLSESPAGRLCMSDLAERMICSRNGLTYQATQLEKAGLLRREANPADERGVLAVITDDGRRVLRQAAPGHVNTVREGLIDLLTDEQVDQLATIMDITRRHLRGLVPLPPARKRKAGKSD